MHRLRWRLCKEFKITVNDKIFNNINNAQYIWYQMQFALDDKENYELLRDIAEHNAMFWNPEGVDQIKESRKNTFTTNTEDFEKTVENLFGRKMDKETEIAIDLEQAIRQDLRQDKADPYLNMELDEISFTPIRGN